jgi:peptide/nickel transport system substrate-binding protein
VHTGPFRLKEFRIGEGLVFEAYDGYYLGRPKIDVVRVRTFSDPNVLFTNLLSGTVDLFPEPTLTTELGFRLKERWDATGEGTVYVVRGTTWFVTPQWRPAVQTEPASLDVRVRAALYYAIDRDALAEGLQGGHTELAAYSLITPGYRNHEASTNDMLKYKYNPDQARALLREAGWTPGPDGVLRNAADGRRFRTPLTTTLGNDIASISDYWQRIGLEVEQITLSESQSRDSQVRALYPGWEASGNNAGDGVLNRLLGPAASAANRWSGNRGGYEDPRAQQLIRTYYRSLGDQEQFQAMKAISDFVAAELPIMPLYYNARHIGVRKGLQAMDDVQWRGDVGTEVRNAHLWDL